MKDWRGLPFSFHSDNGDNGVMTMGSSPILTLRSHAVLAPVETAEEIVDLISFSCEACEVCRKPATVMCATCVTEGEDVTGARCSRCRKHERKKTSGFFFEVKQGKRYTVGKAARDA